MNGNRSGSSSGDELTVTPPVELDVSFFVTDELSASFEETPGYWNKGISWDSLCVDNSKSASENSFCAISEFSLIIFEFKRKLLNCDNS